MRDDLVNALPVVCTLDPAIDHVASDVIKYADTRDLTRLAYVPGRQPIVFRLRPIGMHLMTQWVDATPSVPEKWRRAFQVSVREIERYPDVDGPRRYHPTHPLRLPKGELLTIGDEEIDEMAERLGGQGWIYEIGHVAYERALLGKALSDGVLSWSLPPSSLAVLDRMMRQRAEQIRRRAATTSSAASRGDSGPTSAPPSAPPSDAAAAPSGGTSEAGVDSR
jgi:hypothetical protein